MTHAEIIELAAYHERQAKHYSEPIAGRTVIEQHARLDHAAWHAAQAEKLEDLAKAFTELVTS